MAYRLLQMLLLIPVGTDEPSLNNRSRAVCQIFEGVAIVKRDIAIFSNFEGTYPLFDAKNPCGVYSDGGKRFFCRKTIRSCDGRLKKKNPYLGDIRLETGFDGKRNSRFLEFGGSLETQVLRVAERSLHRRMQGDGDACRLDFLQ